MIGSVSTNFFFNKAFSNFVKHGFTWIEDIHFRKTYPRSLFQLYFRIFSLNAGGTCPVNAGKIGVIPNKTLTIKNLFL